MSNLDDLRELARSIGRNKIKSVNLIGVILLTCLKSSEAVQEKKEKQNDNNNFHFQGNLLGNFKYLPNLPIICW